MSTAAPSRNVEASLDASGSRPSEVVVVGAHYDTAAGAPGADDNASGVAVLLALARAFDGTSRSAGSIRFVAFVERGAAALLEPLDGKPRTMHRLARSTATRSSPC